MADNFNTFLPLPSYYVQTPSGLVRVAFAEHHNIMQELFLTRTGTGAVQPLFAELANYGFDVKSFADNGTPLPLSQAAADVVGSAYHGGNHPATTDWVRDRLKINQRIDDFRTGNFGNYSKQQWLANVAAEANGLSAYLRTELMNPGSPLALVAKDLDAINPGSSFAQLRQDLRDRLNAIKVFDDVNPGASISQTNKAYQLGAEFGAKLFDPTPGSGTPFDPYRKLSGTTLTSEINSFISGLETIKAQVDAGFISRELVSGNGAAWAAAGEALSNGRVVLALDGVPRPPNSINVSELVTSAAVTAREVPYLLKGLDIAKSLQLSVSPADQVRLGYFSVENRVSAIDIAVLIANGDAAISARLQTSGPSTILNSLTAGDRLAVGAMEHDSPSTLNEVMRRVQAGDSFAAATEGLIENRRLIQGLKLAVASALLTVVGSGFALASDSNSSNGTELGFGLYFGEHSAVASPVLVGAAGELGAVAKLLPDSFRYSGVVGMMGSALVEQYYAYSHDNNAFGLNSARAFGSNLTAVAGGILGSFLGPWGSAVGFGAGKMLGEASIGDFQQWLLENPAEVMALRINTQRAVAASGNIHSDPLTGFVAFNPLEDIASVKVVTNADSSISVVEADGTVVAGGRFSALDGGFARAIEFAKTYSSSVAGTVLLVPRYRSTRADGTYSDPMGYDSSANFDLVQIPPNASELAAGILGLGIVSQSPLVRYLPDTANPDASALTTSFSFNNATHAYEPITTKLSTASGIEIGSTYVPEFRAWNNFIRMPNVDAAVAGLGVTLSWSGPVLGLSSLGTVAPTNVTTSVGGYNIDTLQWSDAAGNPILAIDRSAATALTPAQIFVRQASAEEGVDYTFNAFSFNNASVAVPFNGTTTPGYSEIGQGRILDDGSIVGTAGANGEPVVVRARAAANGTIDFSEGMAEFKKIADEIFRNNYDALAAEAAAAQPIISGAQVGQIFGSSIGQILGSQLGGDSKLGRIAAGTGLSAVLGATGSSLGRFFDGVSTDQSFTAAVDGAFAGFGSSLVANLQTQSIGAVSNFLTAELASSLGVGHSFGGQLFTTAANSFINRAITNVTSNVDIFSGFGTEFFDAPQQLLNGAFTAGGAGLAAATNISSFVGGYLANQIVAPINLAGSLGSSIGGAIGTTILGASSVVSSVATTLGLSTAIDTIATTVLGVILPGIGALIGALLGTVLGNWLGGLFGDKDWSFGVGSALTFDAATGQFSTITTLTHAHNDGATPRAMVKAAQDIVTSIAGAIGGKIVSLDQISFSQTHNVKYHIDNVSGSAGSFSVTTGDANYAVSQTVLAALKAAQFAGGDTTMIAALHASNATTLDRLQGQLSNDNEPMVRLRHVC